MAARRQDRDSDRVNLIPTFTSCENDSMEFLLLLGAVSLLAGSRKPAGSSQAPDPTKVRPMDPALPIGQQSPIPTPLIPGLPDLDGNLTALHYSPTPVTTLFDAPSSGIVAQQLVPGTTQTQTILVNRRGEILGSLAPAIPVGSRRTNDKGQLQQWDGSRWVEK